MAKIINLKQVRKQKSRHRDAAQASENAAKFGRTRAQKDDEALAAERLKRQLDQAELEMPPIGADNDTKSP